MATLNQDNDLSFLEKKDANALSLKDIYFTVMRHIHWILLGAVIGGIVAYFRSDRSDRIYESHARIKINSVTRNRLDNGASMLENITNRRVAISMNAINDAIASHADIVSGIAGSVVLHPCPIFRNWIMPL